VERRRFLGGCAALSGGGSLAALSAWADSAPRFYDRAALVDPLGDPLRARSLKDETNYVFHFPYAGTPCFLLNLGKPTRTAAHLATADKRAYDWPGGTGANAAIVAYSAICAHRLTYPTRDISFISYRTDKTPGNRYAQVIHCCSEHSQYDPSDGGRVVAGPAPQPLAAILLDYAPATDELYAVGTLGGEVFDEFFAKYEFRLGLEYGGKAKTAVEGTCVVSELERYCRQQVKC